MNIDRVIAELVMGWAPMASSHSDIPDMWGCPVTGRRLRDMDKWKPSTTIEQAWKVVERMRELGFMVMIESFQGGDNSGGTGWLVSWEDSAAHTSEQHCAQTAPLAICLSALACLEVNS